MARYYRRRYRTIIRAPKKKWCSNLKDINLQASVPSSGSTSTVHDQVLLAQNKSESTTPTPVVIKTGNFKLQADAHSIGVSVLGTNTIHATLYIMYVPEGMLPLTTTGMQLLIDNHPEWIMAWRVLEGGLTSTSGDYDSTRFTVSSRLKRNLNSGDSVYGIVIANDVNPNVTFIVRGKCQFWTCAN